MTGLAPVVPLPSGSTTGWGAAWAAALDELELEVDRVEAMLADDHARRDAAWTAMAAGQTQWTPPADLPPLPVEFTERALTVLHRQTTAAAALAMAMTANRRQSVVAARMSSDEVARPAYVDRAV
jgi:hypothetical protein